MPRRERRKPRSKLGGTRRSGTSAMKRSRSPSASAAAAQARERNIGRQPDLQDETIEPAA
jgi:hypothetical protein